MTSYALPSVQDPQHSKCQPRIFPTLTTLTQAQMSNSRKDKTDQSVQIFPFVAMGKAGNSTDEWEDFHAQAIEVNDGLTTYSVGCATDPCAGWSGGNTYSYTMVLANNSEFSLSVE